MTTRVRHPLPAQSSDLGAPGGRWYHAGGSISLATPVVMGVLNVTPDSFSDGGDIRDVGSALARAELMIEAGARMLDVGGESTRPGAAEVPADEEVARVIPVVRAIANRFDAPVSIDTRKAQVARAALDVGAVVVNDVSGLAFDVDMASVVAERGAGIVVMHMRGTPADMSEKATYEDVVDEVVAELGESVAHARTAGVESERIVVDPGIGFAKKAEQSLALIAATDRIAAMGFPVLVGPSRKSFLGSVLGVPPMERAVGTAVACLLAYQKGARIFRVHDVAPTVQALAVARAVQAEAGASPNEIMERAE